MNPEKITKLIRVPFKTHKEIAIEAINQNKEIGELIQEIWKKWKEEKGD